MEATTTRQFFVDNLFDGESWRNRVAIEVDPAGLVSRMTENGESRGADQLRGPVIPGIPNLHSHAFQRVMAGLAEYQTHPEDSFWTWRETMYRIAGRVSPEQLEAIASQLYLEMLQSGYTQVCEFHYLHNDVDGRAYSNPTECADRVMSAAARVGIGITMLPVLYQHGGFDGKNLDASQRRFGTSTESFVQMVNGLGDRRSSCRHVGVAFHSLRAVRVETQREVLDQLPADIPVHIHIAEQRPEVEQCLAHHGARPVAYLFDQLDVDQRWCLVHATHLDKQEIALIAGSGAVAGLCPTTEANLGDGVFPLVEFRKAGGVMGIGSDSQSSVSPVEELRWLEYGQRLMSERRNRVATTGETHCGSALWRSAAAGGAQASGQNLGRIVVGARADWVVLDRDAPQLAGRDGDLLLDSLVFAGNRNLVRDVYVAGDAVIRDGRHRQQERVEAAYRQVARDLL